MIGEIIQTRISSFKPVAKKNITTQQELKLIYESSEQVQTFLETWDKEFNLSLRHPLTSDRIEWVNINFKVLLPHFKITIDEVVIEKADVVNIKITRKETQDSEVFIYELTIMQPTNSEVDALITDVYLKNTELNDDDKEVFAWYNTEFERTIVNNSIDE